MQRVSWRYGEPKSSAMSRQPAGNWASPAACSTAGEIGTGSTVEMGFVPNATRGAEFVPTACRSRTNERSWPWRCRTPRVGPGSTPCSGSAAAPPVSEHHLPGSASRRTGYAA